MKIDQIYSCLLKLKLNFCIGPNSNYEQNTFYGYKNKCFHFILENLVSSIEKNSPFPTRKPNGLAVPNEKIKSREHSSIPNVRPTTTDSVLYTRDGSFEHPTISLNRSVRK